MGKLEDDVRELILGRRRSVAAFAREIGIPEHTLYSALDKGLRNTTVSTMAPICSALNLDLIEVTNGSLSLTDKRPSPVFVPVYGSIVAGVPIETQEVIDEYPIPAELHAKYPDAFMLRIRGNSMNRVLANGSMALVDPCDRVDVSGKAYVVAVGGQEAIVRRVILHDNGMTLQPDSDDPTYRPTLVDYADDDAPSVSVVGRVVWWCAPLP